MQTVRELFARDIKVHILNIGLIENTLTGNLILTVFLAFAEFERGMILERTQNGKVVARMQPDYREGRPPKYKPAQISHALELLNSGMTYRRVGELTGISKKHFDTGEEEAEMTSSPTEVDRHRRGYIP